VNTEDTTDILFANRASIIRQSTESFFLRPKSWNRTEVVSYAGREMCRCRRWVGREDRHGEDLRGGQALAIL